MPQPSTTEPSAASAAGEPVPVETVLWCPTCSARLTERKCKLICETCGYYMSCADYI